MAYVVDEPFSIFIFDGPYSFCVVFSIHQADDVVIENLSLREGDGIADFDIANRLIFEAVLKYD